MMLLQLLSSIQKFILKNRSGRPGYLSGGGGPLYWQVTEDTSLVHQIMNALYQLKIQSVMVEGGAKFLQSFIDEGIWDEARIISNRQLTIGNGLAAPQLTNAFKAGEQNILSDKIET